MSHAPRGDILSVTVWDFLCRLLVVAHVVGLLTGLVVDNSRNPEQLISLAGFCVLVLFLFACSKHHGAVCVSGVAWPLVPSWEEDTQHWGTNASFPPASLDGQGLERGSWAEQDRAWGAELVGRRDPQSHPPALLRAAQPRAPPRHLHPLFHRVHRNGSDPEAQHRSSTDA